MKNLLLTSVIILFTMPFAWTQSTYTVNSDLTAGANFSSLQAAIDSISNGDTLLVAGGAYSYTVINKAVVIIGPGFFYGANPQTGISAAVVNGMKLNSGAEGTTIMGMKFTVNTTSVSALLIENVTNGTVMIRHNYLGDNAGGFNHNDDAILRIENSSNIYLYQNFINNLHVGNSRADAIRINNSSATFRNNLIRSNRGIIRNVGSSSANFQQNTLHGLNRSTSLEAGNFIFTNNILYGNIGAVTDTAALATNNICTGTTFSGNGNLQNVASASLFVGSTNQPSIDKQYHLAVGSPAINAGQGGEDCGMYGGSTPYEPNGFPTGPAIIELSVPSTTSGSLIINIKARNQ